PQTYPPSSFSNSPLSTDFHTTPTLTPPLGRQDAAPNLQWEAALRDPKLLRPLMADVGLIVLFILQNNLMATQQVKHWTRSCFGVLQRSFYVFCTALTLQLLMRYWQPVEDASVLWNTSTEPWVTWLMGVKQVYYHCLGMGDPLAVKSTSAIRLFSHLCHPVYLEFLLILWAVPCLSLDRLLLALLFTQDYLYLRAQLDKKFQIFSREEAAYGSEWPLRP
uniref:Nurim n=1 Tax=Podarcis muralis TaxID=64176 RepID=A0A670KER1_PODMU